ncbi:GNAT family N-acetyltransferase [Paenibacillus sp. FSL K6-1230]|uniref:GNAT family N-acetyltransferase n=1 Tax=Paenibacillus sp. FSL K6-1230 TaxID=2921603 RepID=UPI0030F75D5B
MYERIHIMEYEGCDQSQISKLILHIQQEEYRIPITIEDQPDLLAIEQYYQRGNGNFWVAKDGDRIIGTIALLDIGRQQSALRKMFVHHEYRGTEWKVAYRLLQEAIRWAGSRQVSDIYLGTTPQFVAAHRFYEKNSFIEITVDQLPGNFPVMRVDKKFYHYHISPVQP